MLALEDQIHASPTGLRCTWSELRSLADALEQVIDGLFVGYASDEPPPRRGPEADLRRRGRIILEAHDSALWRIYLADDTLGQRLLTTVPGAVRLDPASTAW